jgi:phenylacetate-CoA ligase
MRKFIAKKIGYPIQDVVKGTRILPTMDFLRLSQHWDEDKLNDYRLKKLINLVKYAYDNVPYYQNLFNSIKLKPADIRGIEDIRKIPILTKEIVRKENMNMVSRTFDMKHVMKGKTGGTTGSPVITFSDPQNRSFIWASYYRWYEWMGIELGDKATTLWGARTVLSDSLIEKTRNRLINFLQNSITINSFEMNEVTLPLIYEKIKKSQPVILKGYLSALLYLANYCESVNDKSIRPKVLSTTTETLLPHNRLYLEKILQAPVYDQYGCGEVSAIAYECSHHNGLHINQEHVIVEILDESGCCTEGQTGRMITTGLDNYVMPFIRFENGDSAANSPVKCKCGINQPLLTSIAGRIGDTIVLANGSRVHGVFFSDILYELNILAEKIQRFQVYQNAPGEIEFRFESTIKVEDRVMGQLKEALLKFFNKVEIRHVKKLQNEENGKFRYIKTTLIT